MNFTKLQQDLLATWAIHPDECPHYYKDTAGTWLIPKRGGAIYLIPEEKFFLDRSKMKERDTFPVQVPVGPNGRLTLCDGRYFGEATALVGEDHFVLIDSNDLNNFSLMDAVFYQDDPKGPIAIYEPLHDDGAKILVGMVLPINLKPVES